jgi:prevent-host-death family protein
MARTLSEVVAAACETGEPQRIAKRGRVVAVVVESQRFEALRGAAEAATPESAWKSFLAQGA